MILTKNKKIILISVIIIIILLIVFYLFINNNNTKNNINNNIKEHFVDNAISKVSIIGGDNNKDPNKFNLLVSSDGLDWRPSSMNWTSNSSSTDGNQITIPTKTGINNLFERCNAGASGLDENGRALFVIVGYGNNSIAYSYDGVNWVGLGNTIFDKVTGGGNIWGGGRGIAWNGGMWVAVGGSNIGNTAAYSYNGRDWMGAGNNNNTMYTGNYGTGNCVTFIGRTWISGGYTGNTPQGYAGASNLWTSNNGINWRPLPKLGRYEVYSLVYNDKMLIAIYNDIAYAEISKDIIYDNNNNITNINWKYVDKQYDTENNIILPNTTQYLNWYVCAAWNGNQFVAGGGVAGIGKSYLNPSVIDNRDKSIIYSSDGITWKLSNITDTFMGSCKGISWNGSLWIATGGSKGDTIATSTDGINWTKVLNSNNLIYDGNFVISGINASLIKLPPTTTQPTTTRPTTTRPTTTQPTTTRPTTTRPTTTRPTTTRPTTTQPTTTRPTTTRPTTTQPTFASTTLDIMISETTTTQPTTTQPTTTQPTTTQPTTTQSTTTQPTTTQPTTTQSTTTQPTTTKPPLIIYPSIGPSSRIEIISNNMNFAGLLILNQFGNNIFNNDYVTSELNDISGSISTVVLPQISSSPSISNSTIANSNPMNISNAFAQTYNIILNNTDICKFDSNNTDTTNIPNATNLNNNYNICNKPNYIINPNDSSKIFTTSSGIETKLLINIPQIANTNLPLPTNIQINNISKIIFCMIKNINNDDMINSLKVNIYDLNNILISSWNNISTNALNNFSTSNNFISLAIPPTTNSPQITPTQTSNSKFVDIKKSYSYFYDILATDVSFTNYFPGQGNTSLTTMPNTTTPYSTMGNLATSYSTMGNLATSYSTMGNSATSSTMGNSSTSSTMGNSSTSSTMGNLATSSTMGNSSTSSTMGNSSTSCKNEVKGIFPELQSITSFMNDIKSMFPDISQNQIKELIDAGIDINKLKANNEIINNNESINDNGNVLNSKGIHLSNNFKGPSTNIMQVDFTGTSNIYSPYLYYNKATTEKFNSVK